MTVVEAVSMLEKWDEQITGLLKEHEDITRELVDAVRQIGVLEPRRVVHGDRPTIQRRNGVWQAETFYPERKFWEATTLPHLVRQLAQTAEPAIVDLRNAVALARAGRDALRGK